MADNEKMENIGARRLRNRDGKAAGRAVFNAEAQAVTIDADYVDVKLGAGAAEDLARYVL